MAGAKVPLTFRIFKGDQLLREERLSLSVIKLGKVPSAHLKLDDETVSRMHAIIEVNGPGDVSIIDLGSTKGTFVNGQKVNKAKLQSGDLIVVGDTRIEVTIGGADEDEDIPTRVQPSPQEPVIASTPRPAAPPAPLSPPLSAPPEPPPAAPPAFSPPPRPPAPPAFSAPAAAPSSFSGAPPSFSPPAQSGGMRPPPGMPSPFGAPAPAAPMFTAGGESVDDLGGARAVEVAAMLGDSVVTVKHCMNPKGGKVTTATYALFAAGAAMVLVAAIAFTVSVQNAAFNKGKYDHWVNVQKRPSYAFRPTMLSLGYDWMMFGGLAMGLVALTYGLVRYRNEKQSPFFRIGQDGDVEFATQNAPAASFPLVAPLGDDFVFNFGPGMDGEITVDGKSTPLAELAGQGRSRPSSTAPGAIEVPIPNKARIRVRSGQATFLVSAVPAPRRHVAPLFASLESRVLAYFAGSAAVHMGIWLLLRTIGPDAYGMTVDLASLEEGATQASATSQEDPPPPEPEETEDDGADESGGTGTAMALEEGLMGKKESDRKEGQYKMQKTQEQEQLARQAAVEAARSAGVLGSSALAQGGAFASLTGTGDISSGFDDVNIYGGLLGDEAGEMYGGFGFGRSGFGPGGGGTGWGTIGTGRYGTIGHGSGTGSGYGVGGGRGGMRGRTAAVPQVRIGQPSAVGDLDKAIIRRYIKRNISKITYCYEKQLLAKPGLQGTVATQFFISPNGTVASSNASGVDGEVSSCVAAVIKSIEFPKPKGGGGVQVNYPFTFRPTGG
jgi:pSer/pThr/pTyr-binding forkhead associated (FHA) protein